MKQFPLWVSVTILVLLLIGVSALYVYAKKGNVQPALYITENATSTQEVKDEVPEYPLGKPEKAVGTGAAFDPSTLQKGDHVDNFVTTSIDYEEISECKYLKATFKGNLEIIGTFGENTENVMGVFNSPEYNLHDIDSASAVNIPHPKTEEGVFVMDINPDQIVLASGVHEGDTVKARISALEINEVCKGNGSAYAATVTGIQKW